MDKEAIKYPAVVGEKRNNSTLGYADCLIRLIGDGPFENMSNDDLDSIYAIAFRRWAYHLTRQGYVDALYKSRERILSDLNKIEITQRFPLGLHIRNLVDGTIHEVRKYIKDGEGEISIWTNSWYGRHVIGQDCEFVNP